MATSIVTGNGFRTNAQRYLDDGSGNDWGIFNTQFVSIVLQQYQLSFKYRSNCPIFLTTQYQSSIKDYTIYSFPLNTGNCISANQLIYFDYISKLGFMIYKAAYEATSTTSMSIPSVSQTRTFTTQTGLPYLIGIELKIQYSGGDYFWGEITDYNSSNGSTTVTCTYSSGSGTYTSWNIYYQKNGWFELDEVNLYEQ